jgi:monofunctional biosynthetic peptidoglycan transglycosylase
MIFRKAWKLIKWFFIVSIGSVIIFRFIPVPVTPTMMYNCFIQLWDVDRCLKLTKDWEPLDNISSKMQLAVVSSEDQQFYQHTGFDFTAIKKAIRNNERGRKLKGGSTISQQTAKNTFLLPHRNYIRKAFEVYFTILIELLWSKDRIMEVYLNVIEFGNGIYGVQAASKYFFHKDAKNLNSDEAALLASVLPNPIRYRVDKPSSYLLRRKSWIKRQMGHFRTVEVMKAME